MTENLLLEYCSTTNIFVQNFFSIWIFRTGARTRGVNSQRCEVSCEVELTSAAVTKWESRMFLHPVLQAVAIYLIPEYRYPKRSLPPLLRRCAPARVSEIFSYKLEIFSTFMPVRNLFHTKYF